MSTTDTNTTDIRAAVEAALLAGRAAAEIADEMGLAADGDAVVLDGWWASDQGVDLYYPDATTAEEAAEDYAAAYEAEDRTSWVHVYCWRAHLRLERGAVVEGGRDEGHDVRVTIDPTEPACVGDADQEHVWHDATGPRGHGGGVVWIDTCRRCGARRTTDTWGQDWTDGTQGHETTAYADADDDWSPWGGVGDLDALLERAQEIGGGLDYCASMPTFGGATPEDTARVWSWDADRILTGTCADDMEIVDREEVARG